MSTQAKRFELSEKSTVYVDQLPPHLVEYANAAFDKMYALRPDESKVWIGPEKVETKSERAHASYLRTPPLLKDVKKSYMFDNLNPELPSEFIPIKQYFGQHYNQVVVNWYRDGNEFIPMHGDCEHGFAPGADVVVVSLGATRIFKLEARDPNGKIAYLGIPCPTGTIIRMRGETQKEYRHGVDKDDTSQRRISITLRSFL